MGTSAFLGGKFPGLGGGVATAVSCVRSRHTVQDAQPPSFPQPSEWSRFSVTPQHWSPFFSPSDNCVAMSHCDLIGTSLMANQVEHLSVFSFLCVFPLL